MLILRNVKKLYDGSSAGSDALHAGVDVFVDGGKIHGISLLSSTAQSDSLLFEPRLTVRAGDAQHAWGNVAQHRVPLSP